ncbi:MAG: glycosidase [Lachnoanaerobaculum sp.]|nr:glycosidase [Lachnoanaerobaculum sp.]
MNKNNNGPMLNAYPDSLGGNLGDIANFLSKIELKDVFSSFYILPSLFHTDLDRGFSVIDYSLNEMLAQKEDLEKIDELGIDFKLDFILNHASVLSKQFQDIIKNGEKSKYRDFFIDWNKFWAGCGEMTEEGYIQPKPELIKDMFFRKPGLPILMVRFPDGKEVPYWNTFYQEVRYPSLDAVDIRNITGLQYSISEGLASLLNESLRDGKSPEKILNESNIYSNKLSDDQKKELCDKLESERKYLGQMDLNIKSPLVWEFYDNTLKTLADYGAKIVRLDAFAYAPKEVGEKNFLNEPATWDVLTKVRELADKYNVRLLPEIHASYEEKIYEKIADKGYMTYDFFLPGLIIDAFEQQSGEVLKRWADELVEKNIQVVNMLGCHDGIPLLDLKGLISEERIQSVIDTVVKRGGYVKDLHGQKNVYYQVNATYYSALGEEDKRMLLARAIQIFMPGKPQVWYLDLFAGKNDHEAVKRAGAGGHKEINRTNLTTKEMEVGLQRDIVLKQLEMLRFRHTFPVFSNESDFSMKCSGSKLFMEWKNKEERAVLKADLSDFNFDILAEKNGEIIYQYK